MRLIDADALIEYLKKMWSKWDEDDWYEAQAKDAMKDDIEIVNKQPTVDAVPVPDGGIGELSKPILCKECIHRPKMPDNHVDGFDLEFPDHKCPCQCEDGFYSWYPADDWFCANGERRSDEQ